MKTSWLPICFVALSVFFAPGCNDSSKGLGKIHGNVTLDGAPLVEAQIRFFAVNGGVGTDGKVVDGLYNIPSREGMSAGKYRVEFSSEKKTGKRVPDRDGGPGDMKDEVLEGLPAKYNQKSTFQIDFDPSQTKPFNFDLK